MGQVEVETDSYWKFRRLDSENFHLLRRHYYPGNQGAVDAIGAYWVFAVAKIKSGSVKFKRNNQSHVVEGKSYGLFLPPFSLVHWELDNVVQEMECFISLSPLGNGVGQEAVVFPRRGKIQGLKEARREIGSIKKAISIEYNRSPAGIAAKIKREIDRTYLQPVKLGALADKLNVGQTQMGRYFKKHFGLQPIKYRNHMRIVHSVFELMKDKPILDVFQEVGFEDLSRFNKQFKFVAGTTPKKYKPKGKSKNAKK